MIPIPQYSLYSDTLSLYGAYQIRYYLDEDNNWALNADELQRSLDEAKEKCVPRGIVIINPGNPTGQVLSVENIKMVIKFGEKQFVFVFRIFLNYCSVFLLFSL
jgi:alanine transaminase